MKGFLRLYEDGEDIISKLYWSEIQENDLHFFKDKKSHVSSSVVNLAGSDVSTIFSDKYKIKLIQIKTEQGKSILLIPENVKEFDNWLSFLENLARQYNISTHPSPLPRKMRQNNSGEIQRPQTLPRKNQHKFPNEQHLVDGPHFNDDDIHEDPDIIESRQRYTKKNIGGNRQFDVMMKPNHSSIEVAEYRRKSLDYSRPRPPTPTNKAPKRTTNRDIVTVKEDPMMNDDDVLETKTLEELRKRYPISDKTKRWSIAATDIVGKSNDEVFIMLIQLNREKSHMDIWKETLGNQLKKIEIALQNINNDDDRKDLENSHAYVSEQLNEVDYMINLAHPLISFLESVVQMSDLYKGDDHTFHVVYHQHPPSGKEDFSNINFIRHNQEREVALLVNENKNPSQYTNQPYSSFKSPSRLDNSYGKENDPEIALNLEKSQKFLNRRDELNIVLHDIESRLLELDPMKNAVEKYLNNLNIEKNDNSRNELPLTVSHRSSVKSVKNPSVSEIKMNDLALMPRRSTRKSPKSDMYASLSRSGKFTPNSGNPESPFEGQAIKYNKQISITKSLSSTKSHNDLLHIGESLSMKYNYSTNSLKDHKTPRNKDQYNNGKEFLGYSRESRLQSKLRDLVNGDAMAPNLEEQYSVKPEFSDVHEGPLIKLSASKYQNMHRPNRPTPVSNAVQDLGNPTDLRHSISNSDVSVSSTLINQRLNLNDYTDGTKMWKNPGNNNYPTR